MSENGQTNGAIARYEPQQQVGSIGLLRGLLTSNEGRIAEVMPRHVDSHRLLKLFLIAVNKQPKILECTQESVIQTIMDAAQLGLDISGRLGEAWPVPYFNKRKRAYECQLIVGYQGLIKLARQSGEVRRVEAEVVRENDHFVYRKGTQMTIEFEPVLSGERGDVIGAYALVEFTNGGVQTDWMSEADIQRIKQRSKASDSGPWVTDEDEMRRKTVWRRLSKYTPLSSEQYARAIEVSDREFDFSAVKNRVSETEDLNRRLGLAEPEEAPEEPAEAPQEGDPSQLTDEERAEYGIE